MPIEVVSYQTFDRAAKRAVAAELKANGRAISTIGDQYHLMKHGARILVMFPERRTMTIEGDWRNALKQAAKA